jgi:hypothetical protein
MIRSGFMTMGFRFQRWATEFHKKPVTTPSRLAETFAWQLS